MYQVAPPPLRGGWDGLQGQGGAWSEPCHAGRTVSSHLHRQPVGGLLCVSLRLITEREGGFLHEEALEVGVEGLPERRTLT